MFSGSFNDPCKQRTQKGKENCPLAGGFSNQQFATGSNVDCRQATRLRLSQSKCSEFLASIAVELNERLFQCSLDRVGWGNLDTNKDIFNLRFHANAVITEIISYYLHSGIPCNTSVTNVCASSPEKTIYRVLWRHKLPSDRASAGVIWTFKTYTGHKFK